MDKLKERHSFIKTDIYGEQHANITKEIACGFAEWTKLKGWKLSGVKWFKEFSSDHDYTTSELFDLYLKSL